MIKMDVDDLSVLLNKFNAEALRLAVTILRENNQLKAEIARCDKDRESLKLQLAALKAQVKP